MGSSWLLLVGRGMTSPTTAPSRWMDSDLTRVELFLSGTPFWLRTDGISGSCFSSEIPSMLAAVLTGKNDHLAIGWRVDVIRNLTLLFRQTGR
ncbi:hypothetical protein BRADI_2g56525v3 [Brachypodium distachyon]|uniref:Uncharacterized protein n=1 Tax=Brachypodium distachyon TaxID=15368 RepID=A0A2K2DG82_BRADI|nr:hypothetical protein BRADI_2g56525v3 [Brachypodium distachyon]